MQNTLQVYDTAKRPPAFIEELQALIMYKELVVQFVSRAIKTRYKRSILGILWTMLNPLLTMVVLTVVFSAVFRFSVKNYPVYILSGLTAWNFFSSSTSIAMGEMMWSGGLLSRIFVPKSIFAVSSIGTGLVNLLIALIPLFAISIALGVPIRTSILVLPFAILLFAMFALGMALLLSTIAVYFADMLPIYEVLLTLWMYSTPIIYPFEIVPDSLSWLFKLNPLYYLVYLFRAPLYDGKVPELNYWLIGGCFALAAFILGGLTFTAKSHEYAYRI